MAQIKINKLEGHYTIKLVDVLPKRGNSNWLYSLRKDNLSVFYFWSLDNRYEKIDLSNSVLSITAIQEGVNISLTGSGLDSDPYIINAIPETATQTPVTPIGNLSSTNVQDALEELQADFDSISNAEENVQSDWSQTDNTQDDFILNKPTNTSDFVNDGADGSNPFITENDLTTSQITNTVLGNEIAQHSNGDGDTVSINETVTSITESNGTVTYTKEGGGTDTFNVATNTSDLTNDGEDGTNPFITLNEVPDVPEYTLSPISGTNTLDLLKDGLSVSQIDLTPYLDDTNLARIVNGILDSNTGIVTFERDDNSTFTVDLSSLIDPIPTNTSSFINDGEILNAGDRFLLESEFQIANSSNLIIKGVGATINTPTLLAQKFTFSAGDVQNMIVINNNVYATITNESYSFGTFANNTDITYFEEKDGFLDNINTNGVFLNCVNLEYVRVRAKTATQMSNFVNNCPKLSPSKVLLNELEETTFAHNPFWNLKDDNKIITFPSLVKATNCSQWFRGDNNIQADFPVLKEVEGAMFAYSVNLTRLNLPSLQICGTTVDAVGAPWNSGDGVFFAMQKSSASTLSEILINVNRFLQTVNNGQPDTDVGYLLLGESPAVGLPGVGGANRVPTKVNWVNTNPRLGISDVNGIEQFALDLPENLQFKGVSFDPANKRITVDPLNAYTAFVDKTNGNDSTAEINNEVKPFAELNTAITAVISQVGSLTGYRFVIVDNNSTYEIIQPVGDLKYIHIEAISNAKVVQRTSFRTTEAFILKGFGMTYNIEPNSNTTSLQNATMLDLFGCKNVFLEFKGFEFSQDNPATTVQRGIRYYSSTVFTKFKTLENISIGGGYVNGEWVADGFTGNLIAEQGVCTDVLFKNSTSFLSKDIIDKFIYTGTGTYNLVPNCNLVLGGTETPNDGVVKLNWSRGVEFSNAVLNNTRFVGQSFGRIDNSNKMTGKAKVIWNKNYNWLFNNDTNDVKFNLTPTNEIEVNLVKDLVLEVESDNGARCQQNLIRWIDTDFPCQNMVFDNVFIKFDQVNRDIFYIGINIDTFTLGAGWTRDTETFGLLFRNSCKFIGGNNLFKWVNVVNGGATPTTNEYETYKFLSSENCSIVHEGNGTVSTEATLKIHDLNKENYFY